MITGSSDIELSLDNTGTGSLGFVHSAYSLVHLSGTADLGVLGTVDYDFTDIGFDFYTLESKNVTNGVFEFPYDDAVRLAFNQGQVTIANPQGPIAALVGNFLPFELDFTADPFVANPSYTLSEPFHGTADIGPGGNTSDAEANVFVDAISTPIIDVSALQIWARFHGEFHIAHPPLPPRPQPGSDVVCSLNTGIDETTGERLPLGAADETFLFGSESAENPGLAPQVVDLTHSWLPDDASEASRWIGIASPGPIPGSVFGDPGTYFYDVDCDLTGYDPLSASLRDLRFAADDRLVRIWLNGVVLWENPSLNSQFSNWQGLAEFLGFGDFLPGINHLRFEITNGNPAFDEPSPMGLRLEGYVAATAVPEPASWVLALVAVAGIVPCLRRRAIRTRGVAPPGVD
ncbi:MAG: hypothetical protein K1X74_08765 [Pirellulales bacterium]|nr:hypothetical protein [Pirellulales bacterium]